MIQRNVPQKMLAVGQSTSMRQSGALEMDESRSNASRGRNRGETRERYRRQQNEAAPRPHMSPCADCGRHGILCHNSLCPISVHQPKRRQLYGNDGFQKNNKTYPSLRLFRPCSRLRGIYNKPCFQTGSQV